MSNLSKDELQALPGVCPTGPDPATAGTVFQVRGRRDGTSLEGRGWWAVARQSPTLQPLGLCSRCAVGERRK
eukprot:294301-Chlamydomonas_euryale.AAC.1